MTTTSGHSRNCIQKLLDGEVWNDNLLLFYRMGKLLRTLSHDRAYSQVEKRGKGGGGGERKKEGDEEQANVSGSEHFNRSTETKHVASDGQPTGTLDKRATVAHRFTSVILPLQPPGLRIRSGVITEPIRDVQ